MGDHRSARTDDDIPREAGLWRSNAHRVTGVFTDQGVVNEQTVGKPVAQRTVIRIEGNDRHVFEL